MNIAQSFLEKVYTKSQAIKGIRAIKDFLNFRSFNSPQTGSFEQALKSFQTYYSDKLSNFELSQKVNTISLLGEDFFKQFDATDLSTQLSALEKSLEQAKLVTMHVPFEMPFDEAEKIGVWFKANLGKDALFDLILDPALIGGCTLSYKGVEKDYSIRQRIKNNKSKIIDTLGEFRKTV